MNETIYSATRIGLAVSLFSSITLASLETSYAQSNQTTPVSRIETTDLNSGWYINTPPREIDYRALIPSDSRLVAFGERHNSEISKTEVINQLSLFKSLNFTHLGMEAFDADIQDILDTYQQTGQGREQLEKFLNKPQGFGHSSPNATDLYMELMDQAINSGIKVVGLNSLHDRDAKMAQIFKNILDQPQTKLITYTGSGHVMGGVNNFAQMIESYGTTRILLAGGEIKTMHPFDRTFIELDAPRLGIHTRRFVIPGFLRGNIPAYSYNWIIHLPQTD